MSQPENHLGRAEAQKRHNKHDKFSQISYENLSDPLNTGEWQPSRSSVSPCVWVKDGLLCLIEKIWAGKRRAVELNFCVPLLMIQFFLACVKPLSRKSGSR